MKKCLGWHFELERHGSGLNESIELFNVCDGESVGQGENSYEQRIIDGSPSPETIPFEGCCSSY